MSSKPLPPAAPPIVAPAGASAAEASHPDNELDASYQVYEPNPAPWWVALLWVVFLLSGTAYLVVNLSK